MSDTPIKRYAMSMDTRKCVGCHACVLACKAENNTPDGFTRDWIVEAVGGSYPTLTAEIRSERCHHCSNAPCVAVCPTGASFIGEGGIVQVNHDKCTGCKACIAACPYDARFSHPEGYVDKCTFCLHRVRTGLQPACVAVCPTKCMYFGDLEDPGSEIHRLMKKRKFKVLAPQAGTKPQVYYLI